MPQDKPPPPTAVGMAPEMFAKAADVSRETMDRLLAMDAVLLDWSARHNLIARSTIPDRWSRHYLDSVQLVPLLPEGIKRLTDIGSGAGFPGLILAAMLENDGVEVTLVESVGKNVISFGPPVKLWD